MVTISKHAMERYAERIADRDELLDIKRYVSANEKKIIADINKMVEFGNIIYSGRQNRKDSKGIVDVYLKDCWVVLVDNNSKNVITLYKIDLGLDEDFNKDYVCRMLEKLNQQKAFCSEVTSEVEEENATFHDLIEDAEAQIKYYRGAIKNLENLISGYKTIIDNNGVKITQASQGVLEVLNTLIGKREF